MYQHTMAISSRREQFSLMMCEGRLRPYLDGTVDVAAGILEDVLERLAAGLGLVGNAAADEVALSISGDLARYPDLAGGFNGLGLLR